MANMGLLNTDFILDEVSTENLFTDDGVTSTQELPPDDELGDENNENNNDINSTEEDVDTETLFEPIPESVGRKSTKKEEIKDKENTPPTEDADNSPNTNFYSSYANACKVDGIFQNLSDEDIEGINDAESFAEATEKEVQLRLEEAQRRVYEALNAKIEPNVITQYENTLNYLDSLSEVSISEESDEGEKMRTNLIYQDYLNRGFSKERAEREVRRSLDNGTDIEDAKEALISNKQFFKDKYSKLVNDAKQKEFEVKELRRKENDALKTSILTLDNVYGDIKLDVATRQKIYDNLSKPVYKDKTTGEYLTALQKYQLENHQEFLKNVSLFYTLTDGFKNIDALVKDKVKKVKKEGIKGLEQLLTTQPKPVEGNMKYMGGSNDTTGNSFFNGKIKLDI